MGTANSRRIHPEQLLCEFPLYSMSESVIEIDGTFGEGGGQILRSSLALSLLTGKPFRLFNIRGRRPNPGLQPQHLMCVKAAETIGQAKAQGAVKGSRELVFEPGDIIPGKYHFSIGTAGATALVLHTLYLPLALRAHAASEVVISGGTHGKAAPCFHFLETTWSPYLRPLGIQVAVRMIRPGFYPRGGGVIEAKIHPTDKVSGLTRETRPPILRANITSIVAGLPEEIATRQARRAQQRLKSWPQKLRVKAREESWKGGPGTVLAVTLETESQATLFFGLGQRGKKAERVADEAVEQALKYLESGLPVDPYSADQLVLPLSFAEESSRLAVSEVTAHLTTNIGVIQRFIDRPISWEGDEGKPGLVRID